MSKAKVAIVNYLNTKPFLIGLQQEEISKEIEIIECIPADCADLFFDQRVDISLVPVGSLVNKEFALINKYGIACDGKVSSVCLFSEVPIENIKNVYLDYQSRTSVILIQILFNYLWKREVVFLDSEPDYEAKIEKVTAGVIIGDRAIRGKSNYAYSYDLGECWKELTGLPFVFAVWLANEEVPQHLLDIFNKAISNGIGNKQTMIDSIKGYPIDLNIYFNENIKYELGDAYLKGMQLFLQYALELENERIPIPSFF